MPNLTVVATGQPLDWTADCTGEVRRTAEAVANLAQAHDLVHLNSPALAGLAGFEKPVVGAAHSCVRTWWEAVRGGIALPPDLAWRADLVADGYRRCDRLVAPTRSFAQATARAYGLAELPAIVWNGRSDRGSEVPRARHVEESGAADRLEARTTVLRASSRACDAPRHEVREGGSAFAFTAGRLWDEGKGVAVLDAAAPAIRLPVRAAGPTAGPNGARIALSAVRELGRLDESAMAAALAERPIFVSPALYEPFGLAVLEAAAQGCALVLSDIPTFRELWDGAALFVPRREADALATAVNTLADDRDRCAELGRAAAERARRYGLGPFVEGTAAIFRDALGPPRASTRDQPAAAALEAVA